MTFFFNRCLGKRVPREMRAFGVNVRTHDEYFTPVTDDDIWLAFCATNHWFAITEEKMKRRQGLIFRRAVRDHNVGCFAISCSGMRAPDKANLLKQAWPQIEQKSSRTSLPFIWRVMRNGQFARIDLDSLH